MLGMPMQIVAPETLVVVENGGKQGIIVPRNNHTAFMCRWLKLQWLAGLMVCQTKATTGCGRCRHRAFQ